jgi:hypothetical protein
MGIASLSMPLLRNPGKGRRFPQEALWLPKAAGSKYQRQTNINLSIVYLLSFL